MIRRAPGLIRAGVRPPPAVLRAGVGLAALAGAPVGGGGGGGDGGTAAMLGRLVMSRPTVSNFPPLDNLVVHLDPTDRRTYANDTLPNSGDAVDFLRPASGRGGGAVQFGAFASPTFAPNFDGAGHNAIRFTAANSQALQFPIGSTMRTANQAITVAAVARPIMGASTLSLFSMGHDSQADNFRVMARMAFATSGYLWDAHEVAAGTIEGKVAVTPTTETVIMVGQHGSTGYNNRHSVRRQSGTSVASAAAADTLNWASNSLYPDVCALGCQRTGAGAYSQFFDGYLCEFLVWNTLLSDSAVTDLIAVLRAKHGVS